MRVLVTGAGGFVGCALLPALAARGHTVVAAVRRPLGLPDVAEAVVGDIATVADWRPWLEGIDAVAHLAAWVHRPGQRGAEADRAAHAVNAEATGRLAAAAAAAGVRRFVFLSSVKALGESSPGRPLTDADTPAPADAYGRSKLEGERRLAAAAAGTGMAAVSLRPPLVHGPGVRANLLTLLRSIERGVPLPLAAVRNRRSLIHVGTLADAVVRALERPGAEPGPYLVADAPALSTADLVRTLAAGMGREARLWPLPPALLAAAARLPRVGGAVARLTGDLEIDGGRFRRVYDWQPPLPQDEALRRTAAWYAGVSGRSRAGSGS